MTDDEVATLLRNLARQARSLERQLIPFLALDAPGAETTAWLLEEVIAGLEVVARRSEALARLAE